MSRGFPEGRPLTGGWRDDPAWPDVDVVMPIRNERDHLEAAIESVRSQQYPGRLRIFLGVGPSDDGTESLATRLSKAVDDVEAIENPSGITPAALNAAIRAGTAPVIVRVDGHSALPDGYIERAVRVMRSTGAANVGGRQVPQPTTRFERAVAGATTSWLGTGGARYRVGREPGPVDTVYLGVFDRSAVESVGLFDERLIRNQDYELNIRLRKAGGVVWFDPQLWVGYRPRGSWSLVARQYYEYGFWKARVLKLHPDSLRPRQVVATAAGPVLLSVAAMSLRSRGVRRAASTAIGLGLAAAARPRAPTIVIVTTMCWSVGTLSSHLRSWPSDERPAIGPRQASTGVATV